VQPLGLLLMAQLTNVLLACVQC